MQQGFTVVETIMGLGIMAILATLVFLTLLYALTYFGRWQAGIMIENKSQLIAQRISQDVRYASKITATSDTTWIISQPDDHQTIYAIQDNILHRNGLPLHQEDLRVYNFELDSPLRDSLNTIALLNGSYIRFTVSTSRDSLFLNTFIQPRRTYTWQ